MEIIKKFSNRKLYSKESKKYVTLNHILNNVKLEKSFIVVEHGTNKDITDTVLRQAVAVSDISKEILIKAIKFHDAVKI